MGESSPTCSAEQSSLLTLKILPSPTLDYGIAPGISATVTINTSLKYIHAHRCILIGLLSVNIVLRSSAYPVLFVDSSLWHALWHSCPLDSKWGNGKGEWKRPWLLPPHSVLGGLTDEDRLSGLATVEQSCTTSFVRGFFSVWLFLFCPKFESMCAERACRCMWFHPIQNHFSLSHVHCSSWATIMPLPSPFHLFP